MIMNAYENIKSESLKGGGPPILREQLGLLVLIVCEIM
jgi:hypothetical protein